MMTVCDVMRRAARGAAAALVAVLLAANGVAVQTASAQDAPVSDAPMSDAANETAEGGPVEEPAAETNGAEPEPAEAEPSAADAAEPVEENAEAATDVDAAPVEADATEAPASEENEAAADDATASEEDAAEGDQAAAADDEAAADEAVASEEGGDAEGEETAAEGEAGPDGAVASDEGGDAEGEGAAAEGDVESDEALASDEAGAETEEAAPAGRDWGRLQPFADLVEAGGAIIVILALISVATLAIVIVKLVQFSVQRIGDRSFVTPVAEMLRRGERQAALDALVARRCVLARVMETAVRGNILSNDENHVREEVTRVAQVKIDGLERGLAFLSLFATISPLLGLLGTVLGMIEAFQQLENAGDRVDPAILSGGIWEALLTTAAGLTVAIPAAAFYTWFQRAVDAAGQAMEDGATQVFTASIYRAEEGPESAPAHSQAAE